MSSSLVACGCRQGRMHALVCRLGKSPNGDLCQPQRRIAFVDHTVPARHRPKRRWRYGAGWPSVS